MHFKISKSRCTGSGSGASPSIAFATALGLFILFLLLTNYMRCSRYGNGDRMYVILNGEPLEEVDCFKYLGRSQVAADGGCERDVVHRMNEGYRAWGALKSVLSNRGLGIKAKK